MKRYDDVPLPYSSNGPMPTRRPTVRVTGGNDSNGNGNGGGGGLGMGGGTIGRGTGGTVKRSKTLTRPERHVAPEPLINPAGKDDAAAHASGSKLDWWTVTSWIVTFWAPAPLLSAMGIKDPNSRQAWREKITLCFIAIVMGGIVGFATMGLQSALCPGGSNGAGYQLLGSKDGELGDVVVDVVEAWQMRNGGALDSFVTRAPFLGTNRDATALNSQELRTLTVATVSISGWAFNINESKPFGNVNFYEIAKQMPGQDITPYFDRKTQTYPECTGTNFKFATTDLCADKTTQCLLEALNDNNLAKYNVKNETVYEGYSWAQVAKLANYMVIDGWVLNMDPYIKANPQPVSGDIVDSIIRKAIGVQSSSGKDVTRQFYNNAETRAAINCLTSRYLAGKIDKTTPGCFVAALFLYASLIVILGVVLVRFFMAIIFSWFISHRLVEKKTHYRGTGIAPTVMPEGANVSVHNQTGTAPWAQPGRKGQPANVPYPAPVMSLDRIGAELFCVCLVTCYSEGEEGIRNTLDSIAGTHYPDSRKLLWVVCDGMITGAGESQSTPDICVGMLEADPRFGNPQPMGYIAVGSGAKRENRAMVYAGHYGEFPHARQNTNSSHEERAPRTHRHRRQVRHALRGQRQEARKPRQARLAAHPHELLLARDLQRPHDAARLRPLPQGADIDGSHARLLRGLPHGRRRYKSVPRVACLPRQRHGQRQHGHGRLWRDTYRQQATIVGHSYSGMGILHLASSNEGLRVGIRRCHLSAWMLLHVPNQGPQGHGKRLGADSRQARDCSRVQPVGRCDAASKESSSPR